MNDYEIHNLPPCHRCATTGKFHSSHPIFPLFKEINYCPRSNQIYSRAVSPVKPTSIRLSSSATFPKAHEHTEILKCSFAGPSTLSSPIFPGRPFGAACFTFSNSAANLSYFSAKLQLFFPHVIISPYSCSAGLPELTLMVCWPRLFVKCALIFSVCSHKNNIIVRNDVGGAQMTPL